METLAITQSIVIIVLSLSLIFLAVHCLRRLQTRKAVFNMLAHPLTQGEAERNVNLLSETPVNEDEEELTDYEKACYERTIKFFKTFYRSERRAFLRTARKALKKRLCPICGEWLGNEDGTVDSECFYCSHQHDESPLTQYMRMRMQDEQRERSEDE